MPEAYLIDAVRTPIGRKKGSLAQMHPADLGAHSIKALLDRTGVDPLAIDDVVWGCTETIGGQAGDIGRTAWLVAGLPEDVPGVTIDRQCGSSQQAVHFGAQGVIAGAYDLVVAGGVEHMTRVPMGSSMQGPGDALAALRGRYGDRLVPPGMSAEMNSGKAGPAREERG